MIAKKRLTVLILATVVGTSLPGWVSAQGLSPAPAVVTGVLDGRCHRLPDGSYYQVYRFPVTPGQVYDFHLSSRNFDSFLWVQEEGPIGHNVLGRDDDSGGGLDARLVLQFTAPRSVLVVVNSLRRGESGAYRLTVHHRAVALAGPLTVEETRIASKVPPTYPAQVNLPGVVVSPTPARPVPNALPARVTGPGIVVAPSPAPVAPVPSAPTAAPIVGPGSEEGRQELIRRLDELIQMAERNAADCDREAAAASSGPGGPRLVHQQSMGAMARDFRQQAAELRQQKARILQGR